MSEKSKREVCKVCEGFGFIEDSDENEFGDVIEIVFPCSDCHESGLVMNQTIKVRSLLEAQRLHDMSDIRNKPFVTLPRPHSGGLYDLRSEIFGDKEGKLGLVEIADGGAIFVPKYYPESFVTDIRVGRVRRTDETVVKTYVQYTIYEEVDV